MCVCKYVLIMHVHTAIICQCNTFSQMCTCVLHHIVFVYVMCVYNTQQFLFFILMRSYSWDLVIETEPAQLHNKSFSSDVVLLS